MHNQFIQSPVETPAFSVMADKVRYVFSQNFLEKLEQNIANTQSWLNINIDKFHTKQVMTYFFSRFWKKNVLSKLLQYFECSVLQT